MKARVPLGGAEPLGALDDPGRRRSRASRPAPATTAIPPAAAYPTTRLVSVVGVARPPKRQQVPRGRPAATSREKIVARRTLPDNGGQSQSGVPLQAIVMLAGLSGGSRGA